MTMSDYFLSEIVFWMAWIVIPLIMEICPSIFNFFILIGKRIKTSKEKCIEYFPEITLIIPVYNSAETLYACIESIY